MLKHELDIDVLGCSFAISAEEEPEYLESLLEIYRKKLEDTRKSTGLSNELKIAVLTGFLLCDECEKLRSEAFGNESSLRNRAEGKIQNDTDQNHEELREAEKLTLSLITRLNTILGDTPAELGAGKHEDEEVFKLKNTVKNYDWGSADWIPELLGEENDAQIPCAELWMGVHPEGPSRIISGSKKNNEYPLLKDYITGDPEFFLGKEVEKTFGALPFLFKILAVDKPLSIQAHPNLKEALGGWERENLEAIPVNAPKRNYRDANHKPEIICALSPFTALIGFRESTEIRTLLELFLRKAPLTLQAGTSGLLKSLENRENPHRAFLEELFNLGPETREALGVHAVNHALDLQFDLDTAYQDEWKLTASLARLYPGDPALIAPLYLNLIRLKPGEAVYIPSGILHAYIHGQGVELMANSDNVLRGGLTPKHIDLPELFRILNFKASRPDILREPDDSGDMYYRYPAPCREFSLFAVKNSSHIYSETGPAIIIVTRGELAIRGKTGETILKKGESAFIPAKHGSLQFSGNYTLYMAGIGFSNANPG